jgi:hypothetical protein
VRHYRLKSAQTSGAPSLIFEIKIDLQDVRSGYRYSDWGLLLRAPWIDESELEWTEDMVGRVEARDLEEVSPNSYLPWPELADQKISHYLIRYYRPQAWKHTALGLFSNARESKADFVARCRDALRDLLERDLKKVREVFYHRMVELEKRLIMQAEEDELGETWRARRVAQIQDLFNALREVLSRVLLGAVRPFGDLPLPPLAPEMGPDAEAKFRAFRHEFIETYNDVLKDYEGQANEVEPYEVPLVYSHIEIVSRGVLWG